MKRRAFTLVEVLVAVAVTAILVSLLLAVTSNVVRFWTRSTSRLNSAVQGRVILDQIERDLQAAMYRNDGHVWLAATILQDTSLSGYWVNGSQTKPVGASLDLASDDIGACRFGVAGVWLRIFQSTDDSGLAAVKATGYQIIRREMISGAERAYLLCRPEVSAANTMAAGYDLHPNSGGYRTRNATQGNAGNLIRPNINQVMADHVVDFGVRLYASDTSGYRLVFGDSGDTEYLAQEGGDEWPAMAEVMVRILNEEGVRLLRAYEEGQGALGGAGWWAIVDTHSEVFVRRISLLAGDFR